VAVVLTLVQTKQIRINIHKRNNTKNTVQTTQNTVNTNTHITKTPSHYKSHTLQNKLKQPQYKIHPNESQYNQYPQYKVTLMYLCTFISINRNSYHFTLFHLKIKSLQINHVSSHHYTSHHFPFHITSHKSRQFTPHHYTSRHFTLHITSHYTTANSVLPRRVP
jgi:hypothetical protein